MKKYVSYTYNKETEKRSNFQWLDDISHLKLSEFRAYSNYWITNESLEFRDVLYETETLIHDLFKYKEIYSSRSYKPMVNFIFEGNHLFKLIKR